MFRELLAAVRREVSGERARDDVAALTRFHRVQSSPGYAEAAAWLLGALREAGIAAEAVEVPGDGRTRALGVLQQRGWECTRALATLETPTGREPLCAYPEQALSLVLRSAPARGRYPVVDVGEGTRDADYDSRDVKGCVVLASGPAHRVHAMAVVARGAAGLLTDTRRLVPPVRTRDDERDALHYTSFWWAEDEPRGWGFVVTPDAGDRLRGRLARGEALALDVEIDSRDFEIPVPLVTARVGPESDREVLVTAHLCHPRTSANDNGSGVAAALETARVLAALERSGAWRPRRAVRFLWMPELTGTHAWLAGDAGRASRTLAALNLDMVGEDQEACGSTFLLERPPCFLDSFAPELLRRIRREALDEEGRLFGTTGYSLTRIAEVPYSGGSDQVTWNDPAIGVPCPLLIQWPDRYYHSSADTVDKTSPASLALAVRCAATYAGSLAAAGVDAVARLATWVERGAERRLIESLEAPDDARGPERERVRGCAAIASLARLEVGAGERAAATERFEAFARERGVVSRDLPEGGAVLRRRIAAPLDFSFRLWPGYATLTDPERDELAALAEAIPGGSTATEVAWAAVDGRRSLEAIAELVAIETGTHPGVGEDAPGARGLARWFALAGRMGLVERAEAPARR